MPLFLVRWPDLRASLIQANDEEHLVDLIDEVGDPGGCTWSLFEGPVWIDFLLPVEVRVPEAEKPGALRVEDLELDGLEAVAEAVWPSFVLDSPVDADTASEMGLAIYRHAFPHLWRLLKSAMRRKDPEAPLSVSRLKKALRKELEGLIAHRWRGAHLEQREDLEAAILQQLGLTMMTPAIREAIERGLAAADALEPPGGDGEADGAEGAAGGAVLPFKRPVDRGRDPGHDEGDGGQDPSA